MKIESGLFDHMVLQRGPGESSHATFTGTCSATGTVFAEIRNGKKLLSARTKVGRAARGRVTGVLKTLPTGGPYEIRLWIQGSDEQFTVHDVLVGDVWIVAGQSNSEGCGLLQGQPDSDPLVRAFFMNDEWRMAKDPIHNMWECVDQVHIDLCGGGTPGIKEGWGVGPGVPFAVEMRRLTRIPQGLIACGHGGTSMGQWSPTLKHAGTKSLYGAMLRRVNKNGGRVAGMIWYQGESDAVAELTTVYTERMKELVASLRQDLKCTDIKIAMVQIGRVSNWGSETAWNSIQDQQRNLPTLIKGLTVVPSIDLQMDDGIHIGGYGHAVLGPRLAYAMRALRGEKGKAPIAIKDIRIESCDNRTHVVLEFANVDGALKADGRPIGFSILNATRNEMIYDTRLDGNTVILRCDVNPQSTDGVALYYGRGLNPCCNIHDDAGRPLPVMGPVPLGDVMDVTPFVRVLRISPILPGAGTLNKLAYPTRNLELNAKSFGGDFCDMHGEIASMPPGDSLLYYACRFEYADDMRVAMLLGYDGPVKAWIDGREVYHDPNGTNPAQADKARIEFKAKKGRREALIALGTNQGKAWGIFLRFMRILKRGETGAPGTTSIRILG